MRLNKTTTHAVRLLVTCAKSEADVVKVAELALALELGQQNTFKIVHLLSRAGFVRAFRGRYGGVRLARPANEIGIGQVVLAIEYPDFDRASVIPSKVDAIPFEDRAFNAFIDILNENSIADVARNVSGGLSRKTQWNSAEPTHGIRSMNPAKSPTAMPT